MPTEKLFVFSRVICQGMFTIIAILISVAAEMFLLHRPFSVVET